MCTCILHMLWALAWRLKQTTTGMCVCGFKLPLATLAAIGVVPPASIPAGYRLASAVPLLKKTSSGASATNSIVKGASAVRRAFSTTSSSFDEEWQVGRSYTVCTSRVPVYDSMDMCRDPIAQLQRGDEITVLQLISGPLVSIGKVLPRQHSGPGWILLQHRGCASAPAAAPVLKRRIKQRSWAIGGRYELLHPATLRAEPSVFSTVYGELKANDEVVVLDVGYNVDAFRGEPPRLRVKVAADRGVVGWITAVTETNCRLIDTANLLAADIVEVRNKLRRKRHWGVSRLVSKSMSYESTSRPKTRCWSVGGDYRVLQHAELCSGLDEKASVLASVFPGMVVRVSDLGRSPDSKHVMARVSTLPNHEQRGWVRCRSADGFDIIDTRDLSEYDKVHILSV